MRVGVDSGEVIVREIGGEGRVVSRFSRTQAEL
jgi:class 3 adenylate cyclase